jgi:serine/threonine protein kinase
MVPTSLASLRPSYAPCVPAACARPNIVGFVGAIDGLVIVLGWIDDQTLFECITLDRAVEDRLALTAMLASAVPGSSVSTFRTARAVVTKQERLVWCDEILSAHCFVHSLGLTHGDINTHNILIVPSCALHCRAFGRRAKVIEFGWGTAMGKHDYPARCTQPFRAPEITRTSDRAMRSAAAVAEHLGRSKSFSRTGGPSGESAPRVGVASRSPPSNTHTPTHPRTPLPIHPRSRVYRSVWTRPIPQSLSILPPSRLSLRKTRLLLPETRPSLREVNTPKPSLMPFLPEPDRAQKSSGVRPYPLYFRSRLFPMVSSQTRTVLECSSSAPSSISNNRRSQTTIRIALTPTCARTSRTLTLRTTRMAHLPHRTPFQINYSFP